MSKKGKIIVKTNDKICEFSEKAFFKKDRKSMYYVRENTKKCHYIDVVLNHSVNSIEFIDCDFNYLKKIKKLSLSIISYCPIKIINSSIPYSLNIKIHANGNNIEIIDVETTEPTTSNALSVTYDEKGRQMSKEKEVNKKQLAILKIEEGKNVLTDNVKNLGLEITAKNISVSNYLSNIKGNNIILSADNISLNDVTALEPVSAEITAIKKLEWTKTKIISSNIYIHDLFNLHNKKDSNTIYTVDDEMIEKIVVQNKLQSILKGLKTITDVKKHEIIDRKQEKFKVTTDIKIENLKKQIQALEESKALIIERIKDEMENQKINKYVKK